MDSDVYKWLEAVAYHAPGGLDADVQRMADEVIGLVQQAQQESGYLDSYYQVVAPDRHWVEIPMGHELYCAGHLIQAACAWQRWAGDTRLLDVARKVVDHILTRLRAGHPRRHARPPGDRAGAGRAVSGPPDRRYLDLAQFFVDQRGHGLLGAEPALRRLGLLPGSRARARIDRSRRPRRARAVPDDGRDRPVSRNGRTGAARGARRSSGATWSSASCT